MSDAVATDLHSWVTSDLRTIRTRFANGIMANVPTERWKDRVRSPAGESSSIAGMVLHIAYHQDLAIQTAVLGRAPLMASRREALGLAGHPAHVGLSESEVADAVDGLDVVELRAYFDAVLDATDRWFTRIGTNALMTVPPSCRRIAVKAGVTEVDVPWLHSMWHGKPAAWFLQWETVGHAYTHLGEMTGLRGQLGLSPF